MSEVEIDLSSFDSRLDLNNLDKSNWKTYRFDEIAKNISERVDPNNTDLKIYIGLEHIDSESLHIKRHGSPDDVNGTKLKFYKGDIIFGRRRAYQRKAGIATWDGFCSAHALVLRSNPDVIDPELFPFFLHSDLFMNRAIDISVGSLSPTINWGTLQHQSFNIPPLNIQFYFKKILMNQYSSLESHKRLHSKLQVYKGAIQKRMFNKEVYGRTELSKYCSVLAGYAFSSKAFQNDGTPVIKIKNIVKNKILIDDRNNHVDESCLKDLSKFKVSKGDLLVAMTGATLGKIGKVQYEYEGAFLNQRVGKFIPNRSGLSTFIQALCDNNYFLNEVCKYIGEGAQGNVSAEDLGKCSVPKISDKDINNYCELFTKLNCAIENSEIKINSVKDLQSILINKVF